MKAKQNQKIPISSKVKEPDGLKISKEEFLKELEIQWKKKEALYKQVFGPIYSKVNKKKVAIEKKVKKIIDKNFQTLLSSSLQNQKIQNILGKAQSAIEDKNLIQHISQCKDKYSQYINILRDRFYSQKKDKGPTVSQSQLKSVIVKTQESTKNKRKPKSKNNTSSVKRKYTKS